MAAVPNAGPVDVELDDLLAAVENDPDSVAPEALTIVDLDRAHRAMARRAAADRQLAEITALYQTERDRLDLWLSGEQDRHQRKVAWLDLALTGFHRARLAEDPKAKTVRLPDGDLVSRHQPDKVEVVDSEVFIPWAEDTGRTDLIHIKVTPDLRALKAAKAEVTSDGEIIDEYGQFIPGARWIDGEVRFTVKTNGGAS